MTDHSHHGEGEHDQGDVAMPAMPGSSMIKTECGFRFIPAGYSDVKPATVPI
jgi:hypothetical protein